MKWSVMIWLMLCIMTANAGSVSWASDEKKPKSPEQRAWDEVDSLNKQSVQDFLKNFPDGEKAKQAKVALELQYKVISIKEGKSEGDVTISFAMLGKQWKAWQKRNSNKGALGYFVKQGDKSKSLGWFPPGPLSGGKTGAKKTFPFDERGLLISPTGDGSIIAFRTEGSKFELFKGIVFETPGNEPMYFGVIKGKGLVHLKGEGKITLPNGMTINVK
jgi:hypothetical protein